MTIGKTAAREETLELPAGRRLASSWANPAQSAAHLRWRAAGDRYSRRVALLKRVLPVIGLILLVLVAVWPRLDPLLETVRLGFPVIDLREARELRMLNPRYAGVDRLNRPYVVTSAVGRQVPNRDDLMSLERPRAEMTMHRGASVVMTAATAIYQTRAQLLDLFGDVNLVHENGTRFVTKSAHVDVSANTAEGHDPVSGRGPSGDIDAQGFRVLDKGDTIIFTGKSRLVLRGTEPSAKPATPPDVPAEITAAAAQIEAAAAASRIAAPVPAVPGGPAPKPAAADPAARPLAAKKLRAGPRRHARLPARRSAAGGAKRDAG